MGVRVVGPKPAPARRAAGRRLRGRKKCKRAYAMAADMEAVGALPSPEVGKEEGSHEDGANEEPLNDKSAEEGFGSAPAGTSFRGLAGVRRTGRIWLTMGEFALKRWLIDQKWSYVGGYSEDKKRERRKRLARCVREGLLALGPTFIKIGQQFSTRVDLLSEEYVRELERLQDKVPPFDSELAMQIIEEDLGQPVSELFDEFTKEPIAAASLGQVHLAKLEGKPVVVKVQRPGLRELFEIDLANIKTLASLAQQFERSAYSNSGPSGKDWVAVMEECERVMYGEIDYEREGRSADEFARNFEKVEWIKVPAVYWERTSGRVLCMEYVPGTKINNVDELFKMGLDTSRIARLTVEAYLQQLLRHGLFQADPHPGNIAVDPANGGRLIFYDFGMVGRIDSDVRKGLLDLFYGVYEKSTDQCLDALSRMGVLLPTGDLSAIRRTTAYFLDSFEKRLQAQEEERKRTGENFSTAGKDLSKEELEGERKQALATLGEDILSVSRDQPFRFPSTFTFVARAFSMLDGLGKSLDKRFDMTEISRPYAKELLLEAQQIALPPQVVARQRQLQRAIDSGWKTFLNVLRSPNSINSMATYLSKVEQGDVKPRVRALEVERALEKNQAMLELAVAVLACCTAVNVGTAFLMTGPARVAAKVAFYLAGAFGVVALSKLRRWRRLLRDESILVGAS